MKLCRYNNPGEGTNIGLWAGAGHPLLIKRGWVEGQGHRANYWAVSVLAKDCENPAQAYEISGWLARNGLHFTPFGTRREATAAARLAIAVDPPPWLS